MCGSHSILLRLPKTRCHRSFWPGVSWEGSGSGFFLGLTSAPPAPLRRRAAGGFGPSAPVVAKSSPILFCSHLPIPKWAPTSAESGRHGFSRLYFLSTIFPPMSGLRSQIARPPSACISILRQRVAVLTRPGRYHIIGRDHDTLNYMPPHPASRPVF